MKLYYKGLKRKAFTLLNLNRRMTLLKLTKARKLYSQNLLYKGLHSWLNNIQQALQAKKKQMAPAPTSANVRKLVEVQPIIDKDLSYAYPQCRGGELSPRGYILSNNLSQPVFNVFRVGAGGGDTSSFHDHTLQPMLYKTGASTIDQQQSFHQNTLSRNYSPVKDGKPSSSSFAWKLV